MASSNKQLTLFLFCMLATGYHCDSLAAYAPRYKSHAYRPAMQMYGLPYRPLALKAKYPLLCPRDSEDDSGDDSGHDNTPKAILPTIYEKMQLNGDKEALTSALSYLEQRFPKGCWHSFGMKEIKEVLNSSLTNYLHSIRTDDLAKVKTKIESLGLAISQGTYKNPVEYIKTYNAALHIYGKRCDHPLIKEDDEKEEAAIAHEKNIALAAVTGQQLAAQKEIELAKQQLLAQAKKIIHPLERKKVYDQIDELEKSYRNLSMSDFSYDQAPLALEQEKQALLKHAKRIVHPLERQKAYYQADIIEAAIQALAESEL